MLFFAAYCVCFFITPRQWLGETGRSVVRGVKQPVDTFVRGSLTTFTEVTGIQLPSHTFVRHGVYLFLVSVVIPWTLMAVLRRGRPVEIGFRRPNVIALRVLVCSFAVALPFLWWMVGSAGFASGYKPHLRSAGAVLFLVYYAVNMTGEHFLFHGIMLAAFRRQLRWPEPAVVEPVGGLGLRRAATWLGLAQTGGDARGHRRITRWLGLPTGCVPAVLWSAVLFCAIHAGKDQRELLLSFPGGAVLAYLAYRTNSWLTPYVLHLATAGTACAMMLWRFGAD
ncbi:MAG: CPBP family intramembrane metalloprotease [Phycisphaerales bacterium]|nr:CPBP family intramembrane metalloprotease [Phycisphaerales bacterium]